MGDWDEDAHPRDEKGKFSSGGGGSSAESVKKWAGSRSETPSPGHVLAGIKGLPMKGGDGEKKKSGDKAPSPKRTWTDKRPEGLPEETWKEHFDAHPDKGGKPNPERERTVHAPIMKAALDHVPSVPKGEQKIAIMTMGAPASGKSSGLRSIDTKNFVHVDPDGIKEKLPEYQKAIDPSNTFKGAAAMVHEESSHVAKRIMSEGIKRNQHLVVDGTGTSAESMIKKINALKESGYHVHLVMSHLDKAEGMKRASARAEVTGRDVPHHVISEGYEKVPRNFEKIAKHVDTFHMVDSRKPGSPAVWSKGSDGKENHHDPDFVASFRKEYGG